MNRPNVLLITVDQWPGQFLGVAGHQQVLTPTIDQLARNGVRFTNAYAPTPICIPARRSLMTGTSPRVHGDRTFLVNGTMPPHLPTMAQTFRDAGYQAFAVGKLHVHPARERVGFDDVILAEEGRANKGIVDDYEMYLAEQGYPGQTFAHGMSNNDYQTRPWHLAEEHHVTNWTTREMVRLIKRRDPSRPQLWYLSYSAPHPPLVPLQAYLDMYRDVEIELPPRGSWLDREDVPFFVRAVQGNWDYFSDREVRDILRAYYAMCTHVDHQLRVIIGTLREELLLDDTIILLTSDHGDMLGTHGLWAKRLFYENAAKVPMILVGTGASERGFDPRVGHHRVDDRLVGLQDVMPTLLELADIEIPETVDGVSMLSEQQRSYFFGECVEDAGATRMIHDGRFKLIYYAVGNHTQLFDLEDDPDELTDLANLPEYQEVRDRLTELLVGELYGSDEEWLDAEGVLVGLPDIDFEPGPRRGLVGQRGIHWPQPPPDPSDRPTGIPTG